jgi:hypothetical protein
MKWIVLTIAAIVAVAAPAQAQGGRLPKKIGDCVMTTIKEIGDRSGDALDPNKPDITLGTLVTFANGGVQVSYQWESVIARSRVGDKVRVCLVEIPSECPPGDTRGKVYNTTNLRTREAWTLSDSLHMCGGA